MSRFDIKYNAAPSSVVTALAKEGSLWFESAFCKEQHGGALLFSDPVEVVTLLSPSGLKTFFHTLEQKLAEGYFLAGWLSYEVGCGFEPTLFPPDKVNLPALPLAWFGFYRKPEYFSASEVEQLFADHAAFSPIDLSFDFVETDYAEKIRLIKEQIAAGNIYQVNFTGRYRFTIPQSAEAVFAALRGTQPLSYTAFLKTGDRTILSFSPELFFTRRGKLIQTMPMKGTAARGKTPEEDTALKEALRRCTKNLAENLMIVDLLRNDLGRICTHGSVQAGDLFATETYPTLHQMVSTICGEQREDIGLYDLFRALYPSGSITGAPKIKAMKLIQTLESGPRGIYTGTIGFITPRRDMVFSVAIRTIEIAGEEGTYGSGSGIVWDSDPHEEYRECQLKARILGSAVNPELQLFESILYSSAYLWKEEHLKRMESSAIALGFPWDKIAALQRLNQLSEELHAPSSRFKVKLTLSFQGVFTATAQPIEVNNPALPIRICFASERTDSSQPLLLHKTSDRQLYDRFFALARQKGYDEVIFLNQRGEVTEGAISNIFILMGRNIFTPPLESGLLNGIFRRYMLSTRPFVQEKILTLSDLKEADAIYTANSVRGFRPVQFADEQITFD